MAEPLERQVAIFLTGDAATHLDDLRRQWDPTAAERVASHVTVVYPEEIVDLVMLRARLVAAVERISPFPMRLGPVVAHEGKPARGVYHLVDDLVGMWGWLREFVLARPFVPLDVLPHASIVHPATSKAGKKAHKAIAGDDPAIEFRVGELHLVRSDGAEWVVEDTFVLAEPRAP
jgi:hypothetical protein